MLKSLYIKNFILIDEITINFESGFNVFIGETGAGKSLIVDALQVISGQRVTSNIIKKNKDKAIIEAVFELNEQVLSQLHEFELDNEIVITKEITKDKTTTKLNYRPITNALLKQIMPCLVDIHEQHALHEFLNPKTHLSLLDHFANSDLSQYQLAYSKYMQLLNEKNELENNQDYDIDYLKYQLNEIIAVEPKLGEDDELLNIQKQYLQKEKQQHAIQNALDNINLAGIKSLGNIFEDEKLLDLYYQIEEEIDKKINLLNHTDQIDIDYIQDRLFKIQALKRKYGTIDEIIQLKTTIDAKIKKLDDKVYLLSKLEKEIANQYAICLEEAEKISLHRKQQAEKLTTLLTQQLTTLNFNFVLVDIHFTKTAMNHKGIDDITFLVSLNKGEPLQNIEKVASGGELSRILLALKSIFSQYQAVDTLVFDEIDSGVSGKIALSIGKKMHQISKNKQVLCITHLAAVAACATNVYGVFKTTTDDITSSSVKKLKDQELLENIALLSSSHISETTLLNAKSLLEIAEKELNNV